MEIEFISRNEVINRLQEIANDYENARDMDSFYVADYCLRHIMELSPATDVVEVVRCKECLHRCHNGTCEIAPAPTSVFVSDTDFCSHGKRKMDNGN